MSQGTQESSTLGQRTAPLLTPRNTAGESLWLSCLCQVRSLLLNFEQQDNTGPPPGHFQQTGVGGEPLGMSTHTRQRGFINKTELLTSTDPPPGRSSKCSRPGLGLLMGRGPREPVKGNSRSSNPRESKPFRYTPYLSRYQRQAGVFTRHQCV